MAWNIHEKTEGTFDFSGNLDLCAFLDLAREMGLYAIVRPGPYICSEWEFGGLPLVAAEKAGHSAAVHERPLHSGSGSLF